MKKWGLPTNIQKYDKKKALEVIITVNYLKSKRKI